MRTVSVRVADLAKSVLPIGFVGENQHTQVRIDCKMVFADYPTALPALVVKPPKGEAYPAVSVRDGDWVYWDVTDSDLIYQGDGKIQLAFTVDEIVAKTYIARTRINPSILPTGEIPTPVENWLVEANAALNAIPQTIDEALQEAKDSGEFDGFSPIAMVTKVDDTATISITDVNGTTTADIEDGFSPSASVTKEGRVATITITDKDGTTSVQVTDGTGVDVIDDNAGTGVTDKAWSADKLTGEFDLKAPKDSPVFTGSISMGRKSGTTVGPASVAEGDGNTASGGLSHAEGMNTTATNTASHAEGANSVASGMYAHAEGEATIANSKDSHAEGYSSEARGFAAHAEGSSTLASGQNAHAEGAGTRATDTNTHAEGNGSSASGSAAHAEGTNTKASNNSAHAEGIYTQASGQASHAEGMGTNNTSVVYPYNKYENSQRKGYNTSAVPGAKAMASHVEGYNTVANAQNSHAEGNNNYAGGQGSHAEGYRTYTGGVYAHSEGYITTAFGSQSHAEGYNTIAQEQSAHAEGEQTVAAGGGAHSEGGYSVATGIFSHAEGNLTEAASRGAHAEGGNTVASGLYSHAEGASDGYDFYVNGIQYAPGAYGYASHAEGYKTRADEDYAHAEGTLNAALGTASHAEGENTLAEGNRAHTEGYTTVASGDNAHSEGYGSQATATNAHAEGGGTQATATNAHAEGANTAATAVQAHAEGAGTTASGAQSHAEGAGSTASGDNSHAEGASTIASGSQSHAEGAGTHATASQAHAEGAGTWATAVQAHAEGSGTTASGMYSHAEGGGTTASGTQSHAEGGGTTASGIYAHAEGGGSFASGGYAHVEGYGTIAAGAMSHVYGKWNLEDSYANWNEWTANTQYAVGDKVKVTTTVDNVTTVAGYSCKIANSDSTFDSSKWNDLEGRMNYAEIVGNGVDSATNRGNIRALDWDGNEYLRGDIYVGCNPDGTGGTKLTPGGGGGTVTDVQINGTSILSSGVANIPVASGSALGAVKINSQKGVGINSSNELELYKAAGNEVKAGVERAKAIVPYNQHESVFYALSKVAGEDLASATVTTGTYPDASKAAIQHMLGTDTIIAPVETEYAYATQAYPVGAIFAMNGKLYNATSAIATTDTIISGTNCAVTSVAEKLANAQGGLEVVRLA